MTLTARPDTRRRAIEALEDRIATLRRRGWSPDERRAYCNIQPMPDAEIRACLERIEVIRRLT